MEQETVGDLLREWRQRRRMSQMSLALNADVSTRHLSFIESGRAQGSREMLLQLAEHLEMPLRSQNRLLLAGGFSPAYSQSALETDDPNEATVAIDAVVEGFLPYPAIAVDRHWTLMKANAAVMPLLVGCAPELLTAPINALRLSLAPQGLASRIKNLPEWRHHLLNRLQAQIDNSGDPVLRALREELLAMPPGPETRLKKPAGSSIAVPLILEMPDGSILSFITATTIFGTALEVTLSELAIESFLPADAFTRDYCITGGLGPL